MPPKFERVKVHKLVTESVLGVAKWVGVLEMKTKVVQIDADGT